MNSEISYYRNSQTDTSVVGERVIVFERASKSAIVLNPTGAHIWHLLETPHSATQLSAALQTQFPDVAADQLSEDIELYLRELLDQNLIATA